MNGTLLVGDSIVAGTSYGRVKAMFDENGNKIEQAPPSTPVSVLGLNEPPAPGDQFERVKHEKKARSIAEDRITEAEVNARQPAQAMSLEDIFKQFQAGQAKSLNLIIKTDVQGSLQPILDGLEKISGANEEGIKVRVLASDVGSVTESDVMLATAGDAEADKAIIIAFNTTVSNGARSKAQAQGVEIRDYNIIYNLFEDVEQALEGMLDPKYETRVTGHAEVRQLFNISRVGLVAGSYMQEGEAKRKGKARLFRNNKLVADDLNIDALKRFNEDVAEIRTGFEFGVSFANHQDIQEGDIIEFYMMERVR